MVQMEGWTGLEFFVSQALQGQVKALIKKGGGGSREGIMEDALVKQTFRNDIGVFVSLVLKELSKDKK